MDALKSLLLPGNNRNSANLNKPNLEPEIGFKLNLATLNTSTNQQSRDQKIQKHDNNNKNQIPELNIHLIAARHLPSTFGFKTVQGYVVKVKLFPGSTKFDSNIQTSTWPKFNETFKFPLGSSMKSSFKTYNKDQYDGNLPEKLFSGHFVVFTMYALLELPPGNLNRFKGTYQSLKDRSSNILQKFTESNISDNLKNPNEKSNNNTISDQPTSSNSTTTAPATARTMTISESRRNIGSVTCYLEPKLFKQNYKFNYDLYETDEIWLPIKDLTVTPIPAKLNDNNSFISIGTKGQLEIILELCDNLEENNCEKQKLPIKTKWKSQYNDIKNRLKTGNHQNHKQNSQFILKVITSKMRCSIKVKDEYEQCGHGMIYIKTSIYEQNLLIGKWKSENFLPTMSGRWDSNESIITVPINFIENNKQFLCDITIKSTIATKNKMGKKIILGTIILTPTSNQQAAAQWKAIQLNRNQPNAMWHNFQ